LKMTAKYDHKEIASAPKPMTANTGDSIQPLIHRATLAADCRSTSATDLKKPKLPRDTSLGVISRKRRNIIAESISRYQNK